MKQSSFLERDGVLASSIAGSWYPSDSAELWNMLDKFAENVPADDSAAVPNILILPHAGYVYSAQTAMFGVKRLKPGAFRRVVVLCPSHRAYLPDRVGAPLSGRISTPFGEISIDQEALKKFSVRFPVERDDRLHRTEHAAQIEYPLLQYALGDGFTLVPLVVGDLSPEAWNPAAAALRSILDADTLLVISSDFTHYGPGFGFTPFHRHIAESVRELDFSAFQAIRECDAEKFHAFMERTGATICGRNPLELMLRSVSPETSLELLHYATSADETGNNSEFVCYLCAAGHADFSAAVPTNPETSENSAASSDGLSQTEKTHLLQMARKSIAHVLDTHRVLPADAFRLEASEGMMRKMGCFVTLTERDSGNLRGCIGEIQPFRPLYQAVTMRAVDAAFRDPRFSPLTMEEFPRIRLEISALTPEHPVPSWHDIVIGKHGMTLSKYGRMAVFLPQVPPEQNWDLPTTLTHLAIKAGLSPDDWRAGASFTVFEAVVFQEP